MKFPMFLYIAVMAVTTYVIRALPFLFVKKQIENRFVKSFLYYVPYAVLAAMVIPGIFYIGELKPVLAGFVTALLLAWLEKGLIVVALAAAGAVFVWSSFL